MICALFSITMPLISARVVCTLRETIVTLEPTSALTSVDFTTFKAPIAATKVQRVAGRRGAAWGSIRHCCRRCTPSRSIMTEAATFLGSALELPPIPSAGSSPGRIHRDAKLRIVMRPGALDLAVDRRRQALALRPFLQHRLGIAQRPPRLAHPLGPVALDELRRRGIAAVEKHRADHRLADVAEHGFAQPRAGAGADRAELDVFEQPERLRHVRAVSLRTRSASRFDSSPSSAFGKARYSMSDTISPST